MDKIINEIKKNKNIKNFRIYKTESKSASLGIIGKKIGGPYNPITSHTSMGGELQIEWADGDISFVNITSASYENPKDTMKSAKSIKIKDKYAKKFVNPYLIKQPVKQYSEDINEIISKKQSFLVSQLHNLLKLEKACRVKKHEIGISASCSNVQLINSKGLNLSERFTNFTVASEWEMKLYFSINSRILFNISQYKDSIKFIGQLFAATQKPLKLSKFKTKNPKVIIHPHNTWEFFSTFIFSNLRGSLVANNMSRFSKQDFQKNKKMLGDWFTLEINPKKEMTTGASDFTSEGVRNKKTAFIKSGKLVTPLLDLKHAQKLKMEPTTMISSPYVTTYSNKSATHLEKYIKNTKEGILVPYFLGLHTQNQMTGDYSLPVPYAIYIKDGKLLGSMKAIVIGNIFEDLKTNIEFVKSDLFPTPGICYHPTVAIE